MLLVIFQSTNRWVIWARIIFINHKLGDTRMRRFRSLSHHKHFHSYLKICLISLSLLFAACSGQSSRITVFIAETDAAMRDAVNLRLQKRIGGSVVDHSDKAQWIVDEPDDDALSGRLGDEGFALQDRDGKIIISGNRRRSRLYGLWEVIERVRRGESTEQLNIEDVPHYAIRGDTQNPHTPYKLSRQETIDFWEEYFSWAMWMRMNMFLPFQSNGRVIVPQGYPEYADLAFGTGGGYYAMQRIYELCQLYDIDFFYPLHLFPVPAETGRRDEPSTSHEFFYGDGVEDRVPRIGPHALLEETKYHNKFPEYFTEDDEVDLSNPALWRAVETEIKAAKKLFPELKGFLLNFAETNGHTQKFSVIRGQGGSWPILERTFRFVKEKSGGLQLVLFHHGAGLLVFQQGEGPADPITALQNEFNDMLHIVDLHPGPQHPGQPVFGSVGNADLRRRLCESLSTIAWTICDGEHVVRTAAAYSAPGYIYQDLRKAMEYGIRGSFQRTGNYDFGRVPGTLLEVNAYTAYRSLWNPDISLDDIWAEWIGSRFGPELVKPVRAVLEPVEEIIRKGLFLHNCPMFGTMGLQDTEYYMVGGLQNPLTTHEFYTAGVRYPTILDLFQSSGTLLHERLRNNIRDLRFTYVVQQRTRPIADILADRARAVALAEASTTRARMLQPRMKPEDFSLVYDAVESLRYLAEISKLFTEALYLEKMAFIDNYDKIENAVEKYEQAAERLEKRSYEIRRARGDYFFYGIPQAMGAYRQVARLRLEAETARGYRMR